MQSVEEGAQTTNYLATAKEVQDRSGYWFTDCEEQSFYWNVNQDLAEQLWDKTTEILKNK